MDTRISSSTPPSLSTSFSISPWQLFARLGCADAPLVLGVRRALKVKESPRLIATAIRCPPEDVGAFAANQKQSDPAREIVVYCVDGHDVSADAVAILCAADTDCLGLSPESAGLLALSPGLSQLHSDDQAMLAAAMPMDDAPYARCQSLTLAASGGQPVETHNWVPEGMSKAAL